MSVYKQVSSDVRKKHIVVELVPELESRSDYFIFEIIEQPIPELEGEDCVEVARVKGCSNPPREVYEHLWVVHGMLTV